MRLTLILPELESGHSLQTGPKDRINALHWTANRKEPVAIIPVTTHDQKVISFVLLTDSITGSENSCEIKFRPIWLKTFTLCSSTKDTLLALVLECEHGKFWIDKTGHHPTELTLEGNGTDPKTVHNSQYLFGDLLAAPERPEVLRNAIEFIQKKL